MRFRVSYDFDQRQQPGNIVAGGAGEIQGPEISRFCCSPVTFDSTFYGSFSAVVRSKSESPVPLKVFAQFLDVVERSSRAADHVAPTVVPRVDFNSEAARGGRHELPQPDGATRGHRLRSVAAFDNWKQQYGVGQLSASHFLLQVIKKRCCACGCGLQKLAVPGKIFERGFDRTSLSRGESELSANHPPQVRTGIRNHRSHGRWIRCSEFLGYVLCRIEIRLRRRVPDIVRGCRVGCRSKERIPCA